jgi:hypothetical protein
LLAGPDLSAGPPAAEVGYTPPRQQVPKPSGQPAEIDLVFNVTACGSCEFFWPDDPSQQPYGPFPSFEMEIGAPPDLDVPQKTTSFPWLKTTTRPPSFPTPELMDGCRKAPIMTIGINPNLTAFAPGQIGAAWTYPNFADDTDSTLYAKYAYYYRYRSVYQERFELDFIRPFLQPEPRVVAAKAGVIVSADRTSSSPSYALTVRYDGDLTNTVIPLEGQTGQPRWVVLFDPHPPNDRFAAGDLLAATLEVPAGQQVEVYREQVGYYEQFVPVLEAFQELIRGDHPTAELRMGEDVGQLDMVACASPHWTPDYLGGSPQSEQTVIANCVSTNAWAVKQLLQTKPVVLYLVGESSYNMFRDAFGGLIVRDPPLSERPADGAFTLLRETCDSSHPCRIAFEATIDGLAYQLSTQLVVTPHFSYSTNFTPQIRLSPAGWQSLQRDDPDCAQFLTTDKRIVFVPPLQAYDYAAFLISADVEGVMGDLKQRFPQSFDLLEAGFYDSHGMMAGLLADLYGAGQLSYGPVPGGKAGEEALQRTEGPCRFCVNELWTFPLGCPYGKPAQAPLPVGYLDKVAAAFVSAGKRV